MVPMPSHKQISPVEIQLVIVLVVDILLGVQGPMEHGLRDDPMEVFVTERPSRGPGVTLLVQVRAPFPLAVDLSVTCLRTRWASHHRRGCRDCLPLRWLLD